MFIYCGLFIAGFPIANSMFFCFFEPLDGQKTVHYLYECLVQKIRLMFVIYNMFNAYMPIIYSELVKSMFLTLFYLSFGRLGYY